MPEGMVLGYHARNQFVPTVVSKLGVRFASLDEPALRVDGKYKMTSYEVDLSENVRLSTEEYPCKENGDPERDSLSQCWHDYLVREMGCRVGSWNVEHWDPVTKQPIRQ